MNDNACGTSGSRLSFTSPVAVTHTLWAGCAGNLSCGNPTQNVIGLSRREGRLFRNSGGVSTLVALNDNAASTCGCGTLSLITFTIPTAGFYEVRAGCAANTACNGTVAIYRE